MSNQEKVSILFVCLGNICRSPAGEGIMKKIIKSNQLDDKVYIDSAGTSGYHDGELPDKRMRSQGKKRGYDFNSISRKFIRKDFDNFDIILAMDDSNYEDIIDLHPKSGTPRAKVYKMVEFSKKFSHKYIPDPYYSGLDGFDLVIDLLEDACDGLLKHIKEHHLA